MSFTYPTSRATGYTVLYTVWNSDVVDNGKWLGKDKPAVLAVETTNQSIPNNTLTAITFNDADLYDTQSQHDITTNTSRITCGATANIGLYHFSASGLWEGPAVPAGYRYIALRLNGSTILYRTHQTSGTASVPVGWEISGYYRLDAITDYVEVMAFHLQGAALNIASATVSTKFAATWIAA
ncbi:hypothetical protein UFOVP1305_37 [uncultured Caudovirales phage]|uniref:Uncharacterized protein n=1 Tax=uncultured Caudovirales phage TaxID=2100421 RepID=A0A6J5PE15_9CAUD|nr:hypothetical protein UFOVP896_75 [uncultured Caudovirales phage]CAB4197857.1 hypothetical protein UFOVP1305_37 [uncultured Caudovirales phage]